MNTFKYMHAYKHTLMHPYTHASMRSYVHTHILISIHINRCASVQALCGHGGREEIRHARCPPAFARHAHACIHTYIHTCMHACMHACIHICIHSYIHIYTHTFIHACIHTYMDMCAQCTKAYTCTHVQSWSCCVCTFAGLDVRSLVCVSSVCVCPRVLCVHTYKFIVYA